MTSGQDFSYDEGQDFEESSDLPSAFGMTLTPTAVGIASACIGIIGAVYILMTMVMPVQESNQQLKTDKEAKEAQLQQAKKGADNSKINELTNSISQEKVIKNEILSMFANEKTFDTLLIDVNSLITYSKTKLKSYQPQIVEAILINDNSLGASVNNKLQRQAVNLEIEGSFAESMRLIRDLERFQPLLLMKDMSIEAIGSRASNISLSASEILSKPKTELKIRFRLDAISPYGVEAIVANNTPSK